MGERDAFGRETGEDPLADMGWGASSKPRTAPPPAWVASTAPGQAAPPVAPADTQVQRPPSPPLASAGAPPPLYPPPAAPLPRYRRRRRGGFARLIFLLALIVVIAASFGSLMKLGGDAVDRGIRKIGIPSPVATPGALEAESLLRTTALRAALQKLPKGRITTFTVRPGALDATISSGGKTKVVHMTAHGDVTSVTSPVAIPTKPVHVDPAAPARIVRTVTQRSGRDPDTITHLVLVNVGGTAEWQLFYDDGMHYSASASGKKVRRIS